MLGRVLAHYGIGNELIYDQRGRINMTGGIERRERLGGMLNNYYKRAAWTFGRVLAHNDERKAA